jgi:hypothetical protein
MTCASAGTKISVGIDNGDGGGTANNGTLESGEIDQTMYQCLPQLTNSSFDSGGTGWIPAGDATFSGGNANMSQHQGTPTTIAQDVNLTGYSKASITVNWTAGTVYTSGNTIVVVVQPSGGGAALLTQTIAVAATPATWISPAVVDISSVANQPVRVVVGHSAGSGDWHWTIQSVAISAN